MNVPLRVIIGKSPMNTVWRLDLAGGVVGELGGDEQRRRVGHVLVLALLDGRLDVLEARVGEGQAHRAGEVLDRRELVEDLLETGPVAVVACFRRGARHASLPTSQSKDSVCRARRFGTSSGSSDLGEGDPGGSPGERARGGSRTWWRGRLPRCVLPEQRCLTLSVASSARDAAQCPGRPDRAALRRTPHSWGGDT